MLEKGWGGVRGKASRNTPGWCFRDIGSRGIGTYAAAAPDAVLYGQPEADEEGRRVEHELRDGDARPPRRSHTLLLSPFLVPLGADGCSTRFSKTRKTSGSATQDSPSPDKRGN